MDCILFEHWTTEGYCNCSHVLAVVNSCELLQAYVLASLCYEYLAHLSKQEWANCCSYSESLFCKNFANCPPERHHCFYIPTRNEGNALLFHMFTSCKCQCFVFGSFLGVTHLSYWNCKRYLKDFAYFLHASHLCLFFVDLSIQLELNR